MPDAPPSSPANAPVSNIPFTTPDLCDDHPEKVRVIDLDFLNFGARSCFYGEVVTIKCYEDNSLVKQQAALPGHGKVLVVDGGGSRRRALLGDMIAENALSNGWEGIIIYGRIRDVEIIRTLDLGVQALGTVPIKTEKRGLGDLNVELAFGGIQIHPGEYVYADNNGVIVSNTALL